MRIVRFRGKFYAYERVDGKSRRTSLRTDDRGQAERNLADLQAALRRKATTVAEIMEDYLAERGPRLASPTVHFARQRLLPVFGHLRPDQITRALTRAYACQRHRQHVGNGAIRRELGVLGAALRWHDKATPAVIELPAAPAPKSRYLTREEYRALRAAATATPHCLVFVVLAYTTAGRASAILELTWSRVDFDRGLIRLADDTAHGNKGRATVPMTDGARLVLEDAQKASLSNFVVEFAGKPLKSIRKTFANSVSRAGLADVSPHVLRHTAAVHMAESGVSMAEIAQFLGHSSENVTFKTYARYSPDYLRRAAGALE